MKKTSIKSLTKGDLFKLSTRYNAPVYVVNKIVIEYGLVTYVNYSIQNAAKFCSKNSDFDVFPV